MKKLISEIEIIPVKPNNGLIGFASFVYNQDFFFGSIGIYTKPQGGYRLTYPTKNNFNLFHPINKDLARQVEQTVISKFEEVMNTDDRHNKTITR